MSQQSALVLVTFLAALACTQAAASPGSRILAADEGDVLGSHHIKADPQSGSMRLGVGLQRNKGGRGIEMHIHDTEDEILFIHSGSGVGIVGDERKPITAGSTLYIPQGTWHGVESQSDVMEVLWVVSPPHFAEHVREVGATLAREGKISPGKMREIGGKHGLRDFLPLRLAIIAATLGVAAALVTVLSRVHRLRATVIYTVGATLATVVTIFAIAPGYLPPILFPIASAMVLVAVVLGACLGIGVRALARRLTGGSFSTAE
jgi:mannose-6-phosphate isomerase-like protein (cupin superfamily)